MLTCSIRTALLVAVCGALPVCRASEIDFDRDVRPILSENCFHCHGPDGEARQAELRLDTRDGLFEDRGGYQLVVPGEPAASELFHRVSSEDVDLRMPPAETGLSLTEAEIETLKSWIAGGAEWTAHWAFAPLVRRPPPEREHPWPHNAIDQFVLARLEREGLSPSREADREKLIRRVTLDLTGLPPTPEELDAFLSDESADAYEKVVDRLLKSPRYGERMAWDWLDAARYADTDGFQGDPTRTMWPWRDWLVAALNDNKPFDQFTIEMLAGDLLPGATREQLIATGFNRNHMYNGEGGRIAEETRVENVFDRAETTSTVWLGLTMTCARCHDHKYDPITQREYYRLFAFFNNTSESGARGGGKAPPVASYYTPANRRRLAQLKARLASWNRLIASPQPQLDAAQADWERSTAVWLREEYVQAAPVQLGDWWALGPLPAPEGDGEAAFEQDFGPESGVDLGQAFADGQFAWREAAEFADGEVHALPETIGATYLYRTLRAESERVVDLSLGSDDGIKVWLNGEPVLANNVSRGAAADQERLSLALQAGENELLVKIVNTGGIAGFYFRKTGESFGGLPGEVADALLVDVDTRSDEQRELLRNHYRNTYSANWRACVALVDNIKSRIDQLNKSAVPVMVMDTLPDDKRRTTHILNRGIYNQPLEDEVTEGTPEFLPPLPERVTRDRLALARWLVSTGNPLTARVTVNRYWQTFFGVGLVATSEDFGRQGERPSHPELLDWLAASFVDSGWDVKALHKQIVMSATYRQASRAGQPFVDVQSRAGKGGAGSYVDDPANRLLSRGPRYRLPSWMLRDQALAISGLLVDTIGGPPVRPYQPAGIWAEATFDKIRYEQDSGDALYRRSLYTFWRRIVGPTMFFDAGKRQTCEVKQVRTNTPLHALTTLNETTFVEAARQMAERIAYEGGSSPSERIRYAFRLATSRSATEDELRLLVDRWGKLKDEYARHPVAAEELLAVGESPRDTTLDAAEHAAYTVICSLVLNLDEVLTKE